MVIGIWIGPEAVPAGIVTGLMVRFEPASLVKLIVNGFASVPVFATPFAVMTRFAVTFTLPSASLTDSVGLAKLSVAVSLSLTVTVVEVMPLAVIVSVPPGVI